MGMWPYRHGAPSASLLLKSLGQQISVDSCKVLVFLKTSCGRDFNNCSWGKRVIITGGWGCHAWGSVCSWVHPRIFNPALSQGHSQAGFGVRTEPGDELTDVEENKSVGFSNRWCSILCAFGHFTKWASSIILSNVTSPFQLIHFHM